MRRLVRIVKWVVGVGFVVLVVVGGLVAFIGPKIAERVAAQQAEARGPEVDVEPVGVGELVRVVTAPGSVTAKTQVNISARVSAKIIDLPYEAGDEVREGDVIVRLDAEDLEARLESARARLLADEASLKAAEAQLISETAALVGTLASYNKSVADLERAQELHGHGDISEAALDQAMAERDLQKAGYEARKASLEGVRANVEAARARVRVAQADVDQANEALGYATIMSPMDGVIVNVFSKVGEVALGTISNQGAVIMQIADLSEMLVRARVAEVDVAQVSEGQQAKVYINGYANETFGGTIRRIALGNQIASDGTSFFDTEIALHLEEGRRIFAGLTANVDIEVETLTDVMVVPSQAVVDRRVDELPPRVRDSSTALDMERTFTRAVFVHEDGKAMLRPVRIIASNLYNTAIEAGLEMEEEVIVGPFKAIQSLAHDESVRIRGAEDEATEEESGEGVIAEDGEDAEGESTSTEAVTSTTS